MRKVALLIIYNHRFDRNIPLLNDMYMGRFGHVYHIMPFYDGDVPNVIPVYEHSYNFSGYISQAYTHLKDKGFTHFLVVADDMVINPRVNENTIWDVTGINEDECYIDELIVLQERKKWWCRILSALDWDYRKPGVEVENILPGVEEARSRFCKHGIPYSPIPLKRLLANPRKKDFMKMLMHNRELAYPLVGGYSDIFLVTADVMPKFSQYCGAFAATGLFVELAIPTALVLSADKIRLNSDIELEVGAMWEEDDFKILEKYEASLDRLMAEYPEKKLYLHPIKLSKWK